MAKEFIAPTGKIIKEYLDENNISQKELSARTGVSEKHISHVLTGTSRLTEEMALKLEKVLTKVPASYWLNYETKYREYEAREKMPGYEVGSPELKTIASRFHFKEVFKDLGWSLSQQAEEMLSLLQISAFSNFQKAYAGYVVPRAFLHQEGAQEALAIWLNLCREAVEIQNENISATPFCKKTATLVFDGLKTMDYSKDIDGALENVRSRLNSMGVYLVMHPTIANCKILSALVPYKRNPALYINTTHESPNQTWHALLQGIEQLLKHYDGKTPVLLWEKSGPDTQTESPELRFAP